MKRRQFLKRSSTAGLIALITPTGLVQLGRQPGSADSLADSFRQPPHSARPQTWWHWMNGNVTREGITLDLEAMKEIGLGGFQNFDAGTGIPKGPIQYLSPEWLALKEHTIREANRLGLEFTMHNCPGWSSSGGPWVTPDLTMQQLTWSETYLTGGQAVQISLPAPPTRLDYYRDVAVVAFPSLPAEQALAQQAGGRAFGTAPAPPATRQRGEPPFPLPDVPGGYRLTDWRKKANFTFSGVAGSQPHTDVPPADQVIALSAVIDLTSHVDKAGLLTWNVPAGHWTILRFGFTPTNTLNRSAPDTGIGLECDKYSAEAITFHVNKMMEHLLPTLKPLAQQGRVGLLIDSYEVGMQNWTPQFEQTFQQRAGYSLTEHLPALTGRIVNSVDTTERMLWDFRRTQADLIADNYYGQFTKLCHQHGLIAYTEPYDRGPMDEMQVGARVDVNMGEFWNGLSTLFQNNWTMRRTTKLAASIAHINGQRLGTFQVVGAEAFTGEPESARWQEYPFAMKALGDRLFTQGLSRIIFHRYAHQPHPTAVPGMTMGPWGIHFDRTNTWWKPGKAWITYLSRCQSLLQQGTFVADLAYFTGEEGNGYTLINEENLTPAPPVGYDYDLINGETIRQRARVVANRLTLPDGPSYRLLVLQNAKALSLPLLRKLHELVSQGLMVLGDRPERSLGLRARTDSATEFNQLVTALWGPTTGAVTGEHRLGNGRVFTGQSVAAVLQTLAVRPDVVVSSRSGDAPVTYIHRQIDGADVYFLANGRRTTEELVCSFRVANKQPELWDPDTGATTPIGVYELTDGQVRVPVSLGPAGSVFIVFRNPAARSLQAVLAGQTPILSSQPFADVPTKRYPEVQNTFTISLWAKPELNVMLSTRNFMEGITDPWTDHYAIYPPSGQALYGTEHATCGLAIGRNGVAVWERGGGKPVLVLAAPAALSGWSHVALVYEEGTPAVFVNGKLIQQGSRSGSMVHPGLGPARLSDGASFYNGDMSEPTLFTEALSADRLTELDTQPTPMPVTIRPVSVASAGKPGLLFWQNGRYTLRDNGGRNTAVAISALPKPLELAGPWQVAFPPDRGAPARLTLERLLSLHKHTDPGVCYFSGTATYLHTFKLPAPITANRRLFLDLGRVEVLAEVELNGRALGTLWKRPYRIDITDAVATGTNTLTIRTTNGWPNRLIGDAQLPDVDAYTAGGGASGFASLANGAIQALPDWYKQGKPKPNDGRVTFTTWKHYDKDAPLLEAGLIGPVTLHYALFSPTTLA